MLEKVFYWAQRGWEVSAETLRDGIYSRVRTIDLRRTLSDGEMGRDAGRWADLTGNPRRASLPLAESPHVKFLESYRDLGESIFQQERFEQTEYCQNACTCIRVMGHYFGNTTVEGVIEQARTFVALYEDLSAGKFSAVVLSEEKGHSPPNSLPIVRKTLTPGTTQIVDGMHRLSARWVLGKHSAETVVLPPRPTRLQALVVKTNGRRERRLRHPIDGPEFDDSWRLLRPCHERLEKMLEFLSSVDGLEDDGGDSSVSRTLVDFCCDYGWFVSQFAQRGYEAVGVQPDPSLRQIGQIAYGLNDSQLLRQHPEVYLRAGRRHDIVLWLGDLHEHALTSGGMAAEELLKSLDAITGRVLFLEASTTTKVSHGEYSSSARQTEEAVLRLIRDHTSLTRVISLGTGDEDDPQGRGSSGGALFGCVREGTA